MDKICVFCPLYTLFMSGINDTQYIFMSTLWYKVNMSGWKYNWLEIEMKTMAMHK